MVFYTITEEDVEKARSYVPSVEKMEFVKAVADKCFDTLDITASNGNNTNALPSSYKVNTERRSRYLMAAFVGLYLQKDYELDDKDADPWLMSIREYDMYAGGHICEVMTKMKSAAKTRDKAYAILSDYSELKFRLDSDINGLLTAMNDSASRVLAYIEAASSPAEMKKAMEEVTANKELLDEYLAERKDIMEKAIEEPADGDEE